MPHRSRVASRSGVVVICISSVTAAEDPTVVLDSGLFGRGDSWNVSDDPKATPVLAGVQQFTRVCTYDRPGTVIGSAPKDFSRSDPVPMPRNAAAAVTDLHKLLIAAKVPGPYVLVGHSFGGLNSLLYALNYPRSVTGIVLVDALPPELRNQMTPSLWKTYSELNAQPLPGLHYKELERMDFSAGIDQAQRALARTTLPAIPIVVLTKDRPFRSSSARRRAGRVWRKARCRVAQSATATGGLDCPRTAHGRRDVAQRLGRTARRCHRRDPPRRRGRPERPQDGNSIASNVRRDMSMHGRNLRRILALVPLILKNRSDRFAFQFGVRRANELTDPLQEQLRRVRAQHAFDVARLNE